MRCVLALIALALTACPATYYKRDFGNVTAYKLDASKVKKTLGGVQYVAPARDDTLEFRAVLDRKTNELEACLAKTGRGYEFRRDWFVVYVPADWYVSACSGQQVVPSTPDCRLCIDQKGLPLPEKCCGLAKPTSDCPCVCNMRAVVQSSFPTWLIVTAPSLALYKAELARLVTGVNFPWGDDAVKRCLGVKE